MNFFESAMSRKHRQAPCRRKFMMILFNKTTKEGQHVWQYCFGGMSALQCTSLVCTNCRIHETMLMEPSAYCRTLLPLSIQTFPQSSPLCLKVAMLHGIIMHACKLLACYRTFLNRPQYMSQGNHKVLEWLCPHEEKLEAGC